MSKPSRRQRSLLLFTGLVVYAAIIGLLIRDRYVELAASGDHAISAPHIVPPKKEDPILPKATLPDEAMLDVPFMVQAPFANWDALHQETCEEASLMMVRYFRQKEAFGSLQEIDDELKALVAWETGRGFEYDVSLKELSRIARDYYAMTSGRIIVNPTVYDIQSEIAAGRPVIVPAAGRLLDNPNFTGGGPPYHMFVITGYDRNGFITNDPGTRRGENFRYTYQNLMAAVHDWTGDKATITTGQKAVLVFD